MINSVINYFRTPNSESLDDLLPNADAAKALTKEIELTQKYISTEEGRWFRITKIDLSEKKNLIARLAIKLAEIFKRTFDDLVSITKTRPLTLAEERKLEKITKKLENAYKLSGNVTKEIESVRAAAEAKLRAEIKKKRIDEIKNLKAEMLNFRNWAKTPRRDVLRGLPLVNSILWTTKGAQLEAAKTRLKIASEQAKDVIAYPKLLKPCLEEIIAAKTEILGLLTPDTLDYLATSREITEHQAELEKLNKTDK